MYHSIMMDMWLPEGKKLIHTSGVIAKAEFAVTTNNKYTGYTFYNFVGRLSWKVLVNGNSLIN